MGAKMTPTMKKRGSTVLGVRIGCQALSLCCLNAVSKQPKPKERRSEQATRLDNEAVCLCLAQQACLLRRGHRRLEV
jgi:hypothetical protein